MSPPIGTVHADVDLTGQWNTESGLSPGIVCLDFVQTGSSLTATYCDVVAAPFTGTIDPMTGEFEISQPWVCPPATGVIDATATPDGQSFSGTLGVMVPGLLPGQCLHGLLSINGARAPCGDGVLDPGEECDDGNLQNGDCCSVPCKLDPAGSACTSDFDECTDDECDAEGACQHTHNTAPCSDGLACSTGDTCQSGICVGGPGCTVDHYKCYEGSDVANPPLAPATAVLGDQIVPNETVEVLKLKSVCAPVDKNGEGIIDPSTYLVCYQVKAGALASRPQTEVNTQFQTSRFELKKPKLVCAPGAMTLLP